MRLPITRTITVSPATGGDISKRWYSDTARGLETALVDLLTTWIGDRIYKSPVEDPNDPDGVVTNLIIPPVYAGYVPSNLLSPNGELDPPSAPSVLIEAHSARVQIGGQAAERREEYEIAVRIVVTLWDDDPTFSAYADARDFKETLYFKLLQNRVLAGRYPLCNAAEWKNIATGHNNYFISIIELEYQVNTPPDAYDNIADEADENTFLFEDAVIVDATLGTDIPGKS